MAFDLRPENWTDLSWIFHFWELTPYLVQSSCDLSGFLLDELVKDQI